MSDEKINELREKITDELAEVVTSNLGTSQDRATRVASIANRHKQSVIHQAVSHEIDELEQARSTAMIDAAEKMALRIIVPRQG